MSVQLTSAVYYVDYYEKYSRANSFLEHSLALYSISTMVSPWFTNIPGVQGVVNTLETRLVLLLMSIMGRMLRAQTRVRRWSPAHHLTAASLH